MKFGRKLFFATLINLAINPLVYAAAFQFYELGTPVIGTAGVGQAALATDASTSYFNPAGMVELSSSEFMLGAQTIVPFTQFKKNNLNTIFGDSGGEAATLTPGMALYYVYHYSPKLKLGVSFTSPYGGLLNYSDGWVGRYLVQNTEFYTLNLNPSAAYKINNWLAIGAGFAVEYANLYQTVAIPTPFYDPFNIRIDGQANVKVNDTNVGYNVGFLLTPYKSTRIGLAYRSQIVHHLHGNTSFLRIPNTPKTTTEMTMPQNVILSLVQGVSNHFNLLAEVGWSNWSKMKNTTVMVDNLSTNTALDWKNTYRAGLGGQYKLSPHLLLQAGASYDSSPTEESKRTPDLPMDRQIRGGLGVIYSTLKSTQIAFSYEYINFGNADILNTSSTGVMSGSYWKNWANVLQASINVNF